MLQVEGLCAGYGGAPVVQGVSFTLAPGQRLCVLGPNGCGKTTLLRAVAGLLPHSGRVQVAGSDLAALPARARARKVALMGQLTAAAGFAFTAYETVLLGRYAHQGDGWPGQAAGADRAAVRQSMERTGTWALRGRRITELSGGQLQRVLLARTFAQAPAVLLLDEPTSHLDLRYQVELAQTVRAWVQEPGLPRCAVAVLHDLSLALDFADTVLLLDGGRVRAQAPAGQLDGALLNEVYGLDVGAHMRTALARWQKEG